MMRTRERFFIVLVSVCVLQLVYYWLLMLERMASHFDGAGHPNAWSYPRAFFCLYAGLTVMFIVMFRIISPCFAGSLIPTSGCRIESTGWHPKGPRRHFR